MKLSPEQDVVIKNFEKTEAWTIIKGYLEYKMKQLSNISTLKRANDKDELYIDFHKNSAKKDAYHDVIKYVDNKARKNNKEEAANG